MNDWSVRIEQRAKVHEGSYTIDSGMVTVNYRGATKSAAVGGNPPHAVARRLLAELVDEEHELSRRK